MANTHSCPWFADSIWRLGVQMDRRGFFMPNVSATAFQPGEPSARLSRSCRASSSEGSPHVCAAAIWVRAQYSTGTRCRRNRVEFAICLVKHRGSMDGWMDDDHGRNMSNDTRTRASMVRRPYLNAPRADVRIAVEGRPARLAKDLVVAVAS